MPARTIAIGDIHGCSTALDALLDMVDPEKDDTIVGLGDYVDRGPDSKGVLDRLIALKQRCRLVSILGNHDQVMLHARDGYLEFETWLTMGGFDSLESYVANQSDFDLNLDHVPSTHFEFLEQCVPYFEIETHFFVHANYRPNWPLDQQDEDALRWLSLRDSVPPKHRSGKIAVVGHTPQRDVLDLGYLIGLDTGCCTGGWLTAMDVLTRQTWQVDQHGHRRRK